MARPRRGVYEHGGRWYASLPIEVGAKQQKQFSWRASHRGRQ